MNKLNRIQSSGKFACCLLLPWLQVHFFNKYSTAALFPEEKQKKRRNQSGLVWGVPANFY